MWEKNRRECWSWRGLYCVRNNICLKILTKFLGPMSNFRGFCDIQVFWTKFSGRRSTEYCIRSHSQCAKPLKLTFYSRRYNQQRNMEQNLRDLNVTKRQLFEYNLRNCELYSLPRYSVIFIDTNTRISIIFISNILSSQLCLTYCLKRSARIGACRSESFWFPALYLSYNRMLASTSDFQALFITKISS